MRVFGQQALVQILYALAAVVAVVALVSVGLQVKGAFLGLAVAAAVGCLAARSACRHKRSHNRQSLHKLSRFALYGFVAYLAGSLLDYEDTVLVQTLTRDSVKAGWYAAAAGIADAPCGFYTPLLWVLLPSLSRVMTSGDAKRTARYIRQALRLVFLGLIPTAFFLSAVAPQTVALVFSPDYLPAASALHILPFGYVLSIVFQVLTLAIWASGKVWVSSLITLGLVPLHIAGLVLLVPVYGIAGAAFATSFTWLIGTAAVATYVYVAFRASWDWRSVGRIVAASLLAYVPLHEFGVTGVWLLPQVGVAYLLYGALLWMLGEVRMGEMGTITASLLPWLPAREV